MANGGSSGKDYVVLIKLVLTNASFLQMQARKGPLTPETLNVLVRSTTDYIQFQLVEGFRVAFPEHFEVPSIYARADPSGKTIKWFSFVDEYRKFFNQAYKVHDDGYGNYDLYQVKSILSLCYPSDIMPKFIKRSSKAADEGAFAATEVARGLCIRDVPYGKNYYSFPGTEGDDEYFVYQLTAAIPGLVWAYTLLKAGIERSNKLIADYKRALSIERGKIEIAVLDPLTPRTEEERKALRESQGEALRLGAEALEWESDMPDPSFEFGLGSATRALEEWQRLLPSLTRTLFKERPHDKEPSRSPPRTKDPIPPPVRRIVNRTFPRFKDYFNYEPLLMEAGLKRTLEDMQEASAPDREQKEAAEEEEDKILKIYRRGPDGKVLTGREVPPQEPNRAADHRGEKFSFRTAASLTSYQDHLSHSAQSIVNVTAENIRNLVESTLR